MKTWNLFKIVPIVLVLFFCIGSTPVKAWKKCFKNVAVEDRAGCIWLFSGCLEGTLIPLEITKWNIKARSLCSGEVIEWVGPINNPSDGSNSGKNQVRRPVLIPDDFRNPIDGNPPTREQCILFSNACNREIH